MTTTPRNSYRQFASVLWRFFSVVFLVSTCAAQSIYYTVSLQTPAEHLVRVTLNLPAGPSQRDMQLPVWNALYQVRDFAQYVDWVSAKDVAGRPLAIRNVNQSLWRINGAEGGAVVEYEIFTSNPGPYGAELNSEHAFFNLAEILMYPVDARAAPVEIRFSSVPSKWRVATAMASCKEGPAGTCFTADNYDRLVDSPVEIGTFAESDFDSGGGHYRVVVDADKSDYDIRKIVAVVSKIVAAETEWMDDRPFDSYLFIYHFPSEVLYGGMEHSFSTAITMNRRVLAADPQELAEVTAHEFFHLWNVKRIRPQSLEPVDYTKENYCDALWFSEGVTSTVSNYILLRAGLQDEAAYFGHLGEAITTLESRPAHLTQSAEQSSIDAWLEKYPYYNLPERSISYYNKGELLGVLLDLSLRDATNNRDSLRDLFHWMNTNFAKQGRFFPDSDGVRNAAETMSHTLLGAFFDGYVAGSGEVPWDDFFRSVGLRVSKQLHEIADLGFRAARSFDQLPTVEAVSPNSAAERAGLKVDDRIVQINGEAPAPRLQAQMQALRPGDKLRIRIRNTAGERDLEWKIGSAEVFEFALKDVDNITPQQKARRAAWLRGESQGERR